MLATLLFIAGLLHFGILIASALVPQVLAWKSSLARLDPLLRQLIWVHGAFIVLVIVGFGVLTLLYADELASGSPLARALAAFIALFWGARLAVQFFVFDAKPYLKTWILAAGYHGLTLVFAYITVVCAIAAVA